MNMPITSKRAKLFATNSYLYRYFLEKQIDVVLFTKHDADGVMHLLDTDVVIEHIALTTGDERVQIEQILRRIDFANADVNHFLEHLAGGIVAQYGRQQ
jgi:hypothetical protein